MKSAGPLFIAVALLIPAAARSQNLPDPAAADKPYVSIVARNMFGLLPIPPPDTNPPAPPVDPPPKITPNGIMTVFGRKEALFKSTPKPKPGQQPKEQTHCLGEGEMEDEITVVKINDVDSIVTFNNHGTIQELPLVAASNSSGPAPGPGGAPGAGPGNPGPGNPFTGGSRQGMTPGGSMRSRLGAQLPNTAPPGVGASPAPTTSFPSFSQPPAAQPAQQPIEEQVTKALNQMAQMEMNRIATKDAVEQGLMPPLPPTMLTPPDATTRGGAPLVHGPPPLPP